MLQPVLTLYRRHSARCPHAGQGRAWTRCSCPVWCDGTLDGKRIPRSLRTRNWNVAVRKAAEWELIGEPIDPQVRPSIAQACAAFLQDMAAQNLARETQRKMKLLIRQLLDFCAAHELTSMSDLNLPRLREFRAGWTLSPSTATKQIERLRSIYKFWAAADWCPNYAQQLKTPRVDQTPTLPLTQDQVVALIAACDRLGVEDAITQERMRVLLLVLRYTGLRISDATQLHSSQIDGTRLILRQTKTKVPVMMPLPAFLLHRLEAIKMESGYFFKAGAARADVDAGNWRRRWRKLAALANLPGVHPHQLRDTFAVGLLDAGVPLETVSTLLGHSSIRITERHYAPWVKSRQIHLERVLQQAYDAEASASFHPVTPQKIS